ncbi:MAG: pyrroline-5-carboxylate reductase [Blastomonas sp.]
MTDFPEKILLVGCGNMGGAILKGWLQAGLDPARVTIVDPYLESPPAGTRHFPSLEQVDFAPDFVLLGVKPQMLNDVAGQLSETDLSSALMLSILAGTELATLRSAFDGCRSIVRLMPNMAVSIGKSPMVMIGEAAASGDRAMLDAMMHALGPVEWLADEALMHLVTALSGSGPAYVFRFIDALARGAAELGMEQAQAGRLALAMVEGAAALAAASDESPARLAERVASPGGTTRAGMNVLDGDEALARLMQAVLDAAARRSVELSTG